MRLVGQQGCRRSITSKCRVLLGFTTPMIFLLVSILWLQCLSVFGFSPNYPFWGTSMSLSKISRENINGLLPASMRQYKHGVTITQYERDESDADPCDPTTVARTTSQTSQISHDNTPPNDSWLLPPLPTESSRDRRTRLWMQDKKNRQRWRLRSNPGLGSKAVTSYKTRRRRQRVMGPASSLSDILQRYAEGVTKEKEEDDSPPQSFNSLVNEDYGRQRQQEPVQQMDVTASKGNINAPPPSEVDHTETLPSVSVLLHNLMLDIDLPPSDDNERRITEAFSTLSYLMSLHHLTGRQLSRAAWLAERYVSSRSILPHSGAIDDNIFQTTTPHGGGDAAFVLLRQTAEELTGLLLPCSNEDTANSTTASSSFLSPSELCAAVGAYASVSQSREIPTGWNSPPRETRVPWEEWASVKRKRVSSAITFERQGWDDDGSVVGDQQRQSEHEPEKDGFDELFDAIAVRLLSPVTKDKGWKDGVHNTRMKKEKTLLECCSWRELSQIAWAYANRMGQRPMSPTIKTLLHELAAEATQRLAPHSKYGHTPSNVTSSLRSSPPLPKDISLTLWSLGTLQVRHYSLGEDYVTFVDTVAGAMGLGDDDSDTGTLGHSSPERPYSNWNGADLVQFAVSLAHARLDRERVLEELYREGVSQCRTMRSYELSVLLWVQARLYLKDGIFDEFAQSVTNELLRRSSLTPQLINERDQVTNSTSTSMSSTTPLPHHTHPLEHVGIGPREQANIAWSLTVLSTHTHDPNTPILLQHIFATASSSSNPTIHREHAHQLWQSYAVLRHEVGIGGEPVLPIGVISPEFASFLEEAWRTEKSGRKVSSARHRALSRTLDLMGVPHENEGDEDVDATIILTDSKSQWISDATGQHWERGGRAMSRRRVAVEFDGPDHFTRWEQGRKVGGQKEKNLPRALGHTVLKYKLLKCQGWTVVRVPYYEFDRIPFWASMERQRYLQRRLKTHANIQFSRIDVSEYKTLLPNRQSRYD